MAEEEILNDVFGEPNNIDAKRKKDEETYIPIDDKDSTSVQIEEDEILREEEKNYDSSKFYMSEGGVLTEIQESPVVADAVTQAGMGNSYAARKTVAQGMMDIALITANANQLRYLVELNGGSSMFYPVLLMIILSLATQVAVGIGLIFKGKMQYQGTPENTRSQLIDNLCVIGIFIITIANVFIASFTTTNAPAK